MAADNSFRRRDRASAGSIAAPAVLTGGGAHDDVTTAPGRHRGRWSVWAKRGIRIFLVLLVLLVAWLTFTAPLNRSLQPLGAPSLSVLSAEGEVIARKGAKFSDPVDVTNLPPHVAQAFIAVEDKRFFRHLGVDPYGLGRAMARNLGSGSMVEGGSTITQQLAKTSFTGSDRTAFRKVQEAFIALWLEAWLSKEEILSRYLSNVYFGDNVYGLRAASNHYFSVEPEKLTLEQAAMLAGVVNAPSRLAPTRHPNDARERAALVIRRMRDAGFITERQARSVRPAKLKVGPSDETPTGTYFADWVLAQKAEGEDDESYGEREIRTTLELPLQKHAEEVINNAGLGGSQAALVAMRTDGRIVAMVGGRDYDKNAFNRVTQARRQPGSTFKLFVYLAALRAGYRPETPVDDTPLTVGDWTPQNYGKQYSGTISFADAVAKSSNVVAVRLAQRVGIAEVMRAARDLGITTPLEDNRSLPLGTAGVSLLEMTAAYAAVASDSFPVRPIGISEDQGGSWLNGWGDGPAPAQRSDAALAPLRSLLNGVVTRGTGTAANLALPTYGKTGTTQDYRDALFIGFAGDLVVGVWVGNDNNSPLPGVTGGSVPARIWRGFMTQALNTQPAGPVQPVTAPTQNLMIPAEPLGPVDPLANGFDPNQLAPVGPGEPIGDLPIEDVPQLPTPVGPVPERPTPDRPVPAPTPEPREQERPRTLPTPERPRTLPTPEPPR